MNILEVTGLYKEYRLGIINSGTLYRDIQSFFAKVRNKPDPNSLIDTPRLISNKNKTFLALKNINIKFKAGEIIGVIGPNGAGKSTLLKILSKITTPSRGSISYRGRLSSLLEVGTGFHPELTGKENIFLNGSINGMTRKEIENKFEKIRDFSGVGQHLNTPVKRYSSGMIVRLGFAIAAFIEPDILLVDEVLAVGDVAFREKAIKKMRDISNDKKRTVILVSHNLKTISEICSRAILMNQGEICYDADPDTVINEYKKISKIDALKKTGSIKFNDQNNKANFISIKTTDKQNIVSSNFNSNESFNLNLEYEVLISDQYSIIIEYFNETGSLLFVSYDEYIENEWGNQKSKKEGVYKCVFNLPSNIFEPGLINLNISIFSPPASGNTYIVKKQKVFSFTINDSFGQNSTRGSYPYFWGNTMMRPKIKSSTYQVK